MIYDLLIVYYSFFMTAPLHSPYNLVSKLHCKKTKTEFLRCTGYLKPVEIPIKEDVVLIIVRVRQQDFLTCKC